MNELNIPQAANWHCISIIECAPDNTIVYGSLNNLIVICPRDPSQPAHIKKLSPVHSGRIISVSINKTNWNDPNMLVASIADDRLVCLWDLKTMDLKMYHMEHKNKNENPISVSVVGDRVITVTEQGILLIWRISTNEFTRISDLFPDKKLKVKFLSSCPHANWLAAFSVSQGFIYIVDLRRKKIVYKLRSDAKEIKGLSWCPSPFNVFKTHLENNSNSNNGTEELIVKTEHNNDTVPCKLLDTVTNPKEEVSTESVEKKLVDLNISEINDIEKDEITDKERNNDEETDDAFGVDTLNYNERKSQTYAKVNSNNPWGNVQFNDSDNETEESFDVKGIESDFLQECKQLQSILKNETCSEIECNEASDLAVGYDTDVSSSNVKRFISDETSVDYLLAAVKSDGSIWIWRTLIGRVQMILPASGKRLKPNEQNFWKAIYWVKPDVLMVSSNYHFYCWHLLQSNKENLKPRARVIQRHRAVIFCITAPFKLYPKVENISSFESLDDIRVWTSSKDNCLICSGIGPMNKVYASYPTFNSAIKCMALSPIDPTKLAIGLNGGARIWDLSCIQTQIIKMINVKDSNFDRICTLDWHPVKENYLAYGTSDGTIGIYITNNVHKSVMCNQIHKNAVYKVEWGPMPEKKGQYALYSYSAGKLMYFDEYLSLSVDPKKIDIGEHIAQMFAWNADFVILAVGTKDGPVKLLSRDFEVYETFYSLKKAVQCLLWHPESTVADFGRSPYANYLAVATNDVNVCVYNCQTIEKKKSGNKSELIAVLEGHKSSVKYLAWCPQTGGRLASVGDDNTVLVWDVISKTIISSYNDNISAVMWSPIDADLIIIGTKHNTIKIFRISKNLPKIYSLRQKDSKEVILEDNENIVSESCKENAKKTPYILQTIRRLHNLSSGQDVQSFKNLLELHNETTVKTNDNDMDDEEKGVGGESAEVEGVIDSTKLDPVQIFGSRQDMIDILNYEQQRHIRRSYWENACHISLWKGNLAETLETALKHEIVEPWMINMAPMVSHGLWHNLCLQYAEKLNEKGEALEACSYFLACHEVYKAINALCNQHLYREALAVAKCRLPANDAEIKTIYEKWAVFSSRNGNYEIAVQCNLATGKLSDAAILLNKRTEKDKLEFALELAAKCNNHDLEVALNAKLELLNQQTEKSEGNSDSESKYPVINICKSRFEAFMISEDKNNKTDDNENDKHDIDTLNEN